MIKKILGRVTLLALLLTFLVGCEPTRTNMPTAKPRGGTYNGYDTNEEISSAHTTTDSNTYLESEDDPTPISDDPASNEGVSENGTAPASEDVTPEDEEFDPTKILANGPVLEITDPTALSTGPTAPPLERSPTLSWWNFDDSGIHENGANFTPEQMCDQVARIKGAHDIPPRKHWEYIFSRGQRIDCMMCEWSGSLEGEPPFGPSIGDENDERRAEIVRQMKTWIDIGPQHGIFKQLCFFGQKSGDDEAAQWKRIDASLVELAAHAKKRGVSLCFEPLNSINYGQIALAGMKGHINQFNSNPIDFLTHVKKIGDPQYCGLALDFYHPGSQFRKKWLDGISADDASGVMTKKLIKMYNDCQEYVLHIHTAGVFPDDERMRGEIYLPGQLIDHGRLMDHVWESGYRGNYCNECVTTEGHDEEVQDRQSLISIGIDKTVEICQPPASLDTAG